MSDSVNTTSREINREAVGYYDRDADATLKLFIPTAVSERVHTAAKKKLAEVAGGYTAYDGRGGWMHDGELVEEDVVVYEAVATPEDVDADLYPTPASELSGVFHYAAGRLIHDGEHTAMGVLNGTALKVERE